MLSVLILLHSTFVCVASVKNQPGKQGCGAKLTAVCPHWKTDGERLFGVEKSNEFPLHSLAYTHLQVRQSASHAVRIIYMHSSPIAL